MIDWFWLVLTLLPPTCVSNETYWRCGRAWCIARYSCVSVGSWGTICESRWQSEFDYSLWSCGVDEKEQL